MSGQGNTVHVAFIGLGANLGDRRGAIAAALERLDRHPLVRVADISTLHETVPVGGPADQPMYLNGVARLETGLEPLVLLHELLEIERDLGRQRGQRWGPRTIDLDLLLFDDLVLDTPALILPHPRMHERRFVLAPLAEIAADFRHPVFGHTITELLKDIVE